MTLTYLTAIGKKLSLECCDFKLRNYVMALRVSASLYCQLGVVMTNRQSQILTWHDHLACQPIHRDQPIMLIILPIMLCFTTHKAHLLCLY